MKQRFLSSILIVLVAAGLFFGGVWYGRSSSPSIEKVTGLQNLEQGKPQNADFSLFWDAWAKVQEKFVDRGQLDRQKMVYGAISGMLNSLGDPYSVFMTPEENKSFSEAMQGNFEGIGAELGLRNEILTIVAPMDNTPAKKAGLMAGDKIVKINDKSTAGMGVEEAVSQIRGPKGTSVKLAIFREGWDNAKDFTITRDVINIASVKLEFKEVSGKRIAHLTINQFTEDSLSEFEKAAQQVLTSDAKGMVLDMRDNPGGYLDLAVGMAGWFMPEGQLVVTEDYGDGKKIEHKSDGVNKFDSLPVVILLNQGSASASEILAGALRDNNHFKIVGEKSFGKGSVQELEKMRGGTSLKITVAKWLTPSGHCISKEGLEPDFKVEYTKADQEAGRDPQLQKALELLK